MLSCICAALSFAPTPLAGAAITPRGVYPIDAAFARRAAIPEMNELSLAATVVRDIAAVPTMYCLMSLNEYMTHRYFQHLEFNRPESLPWVKSIVARASGVPAAEQRVPGDGHVEHHAETYDDMSLKNDERWRANKAAKSLDDDVYRGTAFHWSATLIMTLQMLPSVLPTYALMGWSLPETMAILRPPPLARPSAIDGVAEVRPVRPAAAAAAIAAAVAVAPATAPAVDGALVRPPAPR